MMQARNRFVGYSAPIKSRQRFSADGFHHLLLIITTDIIFRQSSNKNMTGAQLHISLRDLHLATQTTADTLAFGFLSQQTSRSNEKIKKKAKNRVYLYPDDLEVTLAAELIHFAAFYRTMFLYAPTPVVRNQEIREKKFRTTPCTYLTNRRNAAATILSTLIRKFYAISFTYFVL